MECHLHGAENSLFDSKLLSHGPPFKTLISWSKRSPWRVLLADDKMPQTFVSPGSKCNIFNFVRVF